MPKLETLRLVVFDHLGTLLDAQNRVTLPQLSLQVEFAFRLLTYSQGLLQYGQT